MATENRKFIERRIREISLEIDKKLLAQQTAQQFPQRINMSLLHLMLAEWNKLAKYYEHTNWERNGQEQKKPDLEISVFILQNYLSWVQTLLIFMGGASKRDENQLADELGDALSMLENCMQEIFAACRDEDDLEL